MQTIDEADFKQDNMDLEHLTPAAADNAKSLIETEVCMKFYDDTKALYLETDASGAA